MLVIGAYILHSLVAPLTRCVSRNRFGVVPEVVVGVAPLTRCVSRNRSIRRFYLPRFFVAPLTRCVSRNRTDRRRKFQFFGRTSHEVRE